MDTTVVIIRRALKSEGSQASNVAEGTRRDADGSTDTKVLKTALDKAFNAYVKAEGAEKLTDIPGGPNLKSRAKELLGIPKASQGRKAKSDLDRILEMLAKADLDVAGIGAVADALTAKAVALRTAQEAASVVASIAA